MVEGIDNESTDQTSSQEDDRVDDTNNPLISSLTINAKLLGERQVSTIGTSLIPTLSSGTDGAKTDGVPQHLRSMPLVVSLVDESFALVIEKVDGLEVVGVTGDEGCSAKHLGVFGHAIGLAEEAGVGDGFFLCFALKTKS